MADEPKVEYDPRGGIRNIKGRKLGNTTDFGDVTGLADAAKAAASPKPSPSPGVESPLAKAAREAREKREKAASQAKAVEKP